jgi:hypothetical protein
LQVIKKNCTFNIATRFNLEHTVIIWEENAWDLIENSCHYQRNGWTTDNKGSAVHLISSLDPMAHAPLGPEEPLSLTKSFRANLFKEDVIGQNF